MFPVYPITQKHARLIHQQVILTLAWLHIWEWVPDVLRLPLTVFPSSIEGWSNAEEEFPYEDIQYNIYLIS